MAFTQRFPSPPQSSRARPSRPLRTAEHTLGPTFSDEEDGDDSAFIASKMAVLGLDPNGQPYGVGAFGARTQGRAGTHLLTPRDQGPSASQLPLQQQQQQQNRQRQTFAQLEGQQSKPASLHAQLQQAQQVQILAHTQVQLQAQQAFYIQQQQQQHGAVSIEQLQYFQQVAQLQQRVQLQQQQNQLQFAFLQQQQLHRQQSEGIDDRARMAFDAYQPANKVNSSSQASPASGPATTSSDWRAAKSPQPCKAPANASNETPVPGGRFARAAAAAAAAAAASESSDDFRRDAVTPTTPRSASVPARPDGISGSAELAQMSPFASTDKLQAREKILSFIGKGRPSQLQTPEPTRSWSTPTSTQLALSPIAMPQPRAVSHAYTGEPVSIVLRQPLGPPGDYEGRNFASQIRRKAVNNLGMLGRRTPQP